MAGEPFTLASQIDGSGSDVDLCDERQGVLISAHIDCVAGDAGISIKVGFVRPGAIVGVAGVNARGGFQKMIIAIHPGVIPNIVGCTVVVPVTTCDKAWVGIDVARSPVQCRPAADKHIILATLEVSVA